MEIHLQKIKCAKCGYEWVPRVKRPVKCPRCQTFDWDKESSKGKAEVATD